MSELSHSEFLASLSEWRGERDVVIATMTAGMMWPENSKHDLDLCSMAPMGSASSVALGIALARPDLGVIVIDGDGSLLMNLGSLVTIGGLQPKKLLHIVLENGTYDITGGHPLPGRGTQPAPEIASSLGYARSSRSSDPVQLAAAVDGMHGSEGPILLAVPVQRDYDPAALGELTHNERALRSIGRPGFENLRQALADTPPAP